VTNLNSAVAIDAASDKSCALLESGQVQCWGQKYLTESCSPGAAHDEIPVTVSGIAGASAISVGDDHGCALIADGTIKCWGSNTYGELGNGTTVDSSTPVTVQGIDDATAVTVGSSHSCAALSSGGVKCWGRNDFAELGTPQIYPYYSALPLSVPGVDRVDSISAGWSQTCARQVTGGIWCWGTSLGNLYWAQDNWILADKGPRKVTGIRSAVSISAEGSLSCATLSDGHVQCWGDNDVEQLRLPYKSLPPALGVPVYY
jgi:alpha-tubulin suppressor-like RCC1 family protein